jgi:hypothetical protein
VADRYCRNCGNELGPNDQFCANCGRPVHEAARVPTPEADVAVPPPPQQAGHTATPPQQAGAPQEGWRQRHPILTGCLAIVVLLVFLGILGAALGGGGDEQASSPPERAEQDEGLEGGGPDPEAKQPLQGEEANPQDGQQQEQAV